MPPPAPVIMSSRARLAAVNDGVTPGSGNLFDMNRQKREEISQFLEQNGAGNISAISTGGGGIASNNVSTL